MAIFKCKMCGGELQFNPGESLGTCDYCGTSQTLPKIMDENLQGLFNRANLLRMKAEFDKAADIYEKILQASGTEAEAYWGLILCKYGIEYVEDPVTYKRVPTCHRASYDAVTADDDYKMAIQYADLQQKSVYEAEAKAIDEIQKGILTLAQKEAPYDVFICYKETDDSGNRTQDSVIANDIYYQLTQEGFKVFYAAITLEDKLGQEYEPYIFSALNSAKVMLAIGTKPEYFNAVWVKNEWSRFLKIMKKDRARVLIPCYRDMDAYELPEEFAHLQAQDMSKIGFINDLVRGIKKVIVKEEASAQPQMAAQQVTGYGANTDALLKRAYLVLEDGDFSKADELFEEVLNQNPECAEAYFGKFLVENKSPNTDAVLKVLKNKYIEKKEENLYACDAATAHINQMAEENEVPGFWDKKIIVKKYDFDRTYSSALKCRKNQKVQQINELKANKMLSRTTQFAKGEYKTKLDSLLLEVEKFHDERIAEEQRKDEQSIKQKKEEYEKFIESVDKGVKRKNEETIAKADKEYNYALAEYEEAVKAMTNITLYESAKSSFTNLNAYKDSADYVNKCQAEIDRLNEIQKKKRIQEEEEKARKRKKKIIVVSIASTVVVAALVLLITVIIPSVNYNKAIELVEKNNYKQAKVIFTKLNNYKESDKYIDYCDAGILAEDGKTEEAYNAFKNLGDFNNSEEMLIQIQDKEFEKNYEVGDCIGFGFYEQDNNGDNGKELLSWRVLDKKDNDILVITDKIIDVIPYNDEDKRITWSKCTLRKYLNNEFINNTFEDDIIKMIEETTLENPNNSKYGTKGGPPTKDRVFCLSLDEANTYFKDDNDRGAEPTNYAKKSGGSFWLRTPGNGQNYASYVHDSGLVYDSGRLVFLDDVGIRPALWLHLES
ncbi:MAG: DUF6273 domain-containing protein [Lachnospiraceae bacterium]|nr:DUF6273 domain-containing protein [Lachnospiraceae bacterium]